MSNESNNSSKITLKQVKELISIGNGKVSKKLTGSGAWMQKRLPTIAQKMQTLLKHLDKFINFITKKTGDNRNEVMQNARSPIVFGIYVIIVFVVFGGLWSALAPLNSAVVVIGTVVSNTSKKIIQHPDGGIIKNIFVVQGSAVKEGEKLVELDDTKVKAQYESVSHQYLTVLAVQDRLLAERDNLSAIEFSPFLEQRLNIVEVAKTLHTQENLFNSRKQMYQAERESINQKIAQLNKQIEGLESKKTSLAKNLEILCDRLKAMKVLMSKGFMHKAAILELEAREANLKSDIANCDTDVARSKQEITRCEIEIINLQNKFTTQTLNELKEIQVQAAALREQFFALEDQLKRVIIKSPVDGIVNAINYHTIGGVITPSSPILEISPINDSLIIEARIPHKNIDAVYQNSTVNMRFSAFKSRTTPLFLGWVISISPDVVQDRNPMGMAESFYIARIEINMAEFNKIAKARKLRLQPGMQAEVQIITGTRTLIRYLFDPVIDTINRAFREK